MNAAFFDALRTTVSDGALTQPQVDAINAILGAWNTYGDRDDHKLAYILATAWHETGAFRYMREIWGPTPAQVNYEGRMDLGNAVKGDGQKFMGRGFVQITGRRNYADWSKRLGIDLVAHPHLAEQAETAARILVQGCMLGTFTGKKLGDYITPAGANYVGARRVVNGTDRAPLIAGYARKFEHAIRQAGLTEVLPLPPDPTIPAPHPVEVPEEWHGGTDSPPERSGVPWAVWLTVALIIAIGLWILWVYFNQTPPAQ